MSKFTTQGLRILLLLTMLCGAKLAAVAQGGSIRGRVFDGATNAPLPYATVIIASANKGANTDSAGKFEIKNLPPAVYNVEVRYSGYKPQNVFEVQVTNGKPYQLEIAMEEDKTAATDSVVIAASPFKQSEESPLSLRTIGTNEIQRSPGGNRDISRVIQSLPGVTSSPAGFRNDILIRGGGPGENKFYIDGIEIPNINHFATQGASGGPVGLLNVDFIGNVDFYSGAFPSNRGNALSSVFEFQQRAARTDRLGVTATLGASDLAMTLETPLGKQKNGELMISVRRSYLQFLFSVLGLPFLPIYNDAQIKYKQRFGQRHELTIMGLGARDFNKLNTGIENPDSVQSYILSYLPSQRQNNYTVGASYKYFGNNGYWQVVLSSNCLQNRFEKYLQNDETKPENKQQDFKSVEGETKLRIERTQRSGGWKWNYGIGLEDALYKTDNYQLTSTGGAAFPLVFGSRVRMMKYGAFGQLSRRLAGDRLTLSAGLRMDGTKITFLDEGQAAPASLGKNLRNPLDQLSPRFSASYLLTPALSLNFNTGIFYQLPPYTVLGYRDAGNYVNLDVNNIKYIQCKHIVAGIAYTAKTNTRFSVEAYHKQYQNYPFLLQESVSLANVGLDFGVFGNQPAQSRSAGRTSGVEVMIQQRMNKGFYGILAYTLGISQFDNGSGKYSYSSWDNRHIINLVGGKKWGKKQTWETGFRFRYLSGAPFTPVDTANSARIGVYEANLQGVRDYANNLNTGRIKPFYQLDMRIDKKFFFEKWSLNVYMDVQNLTGNAVPGAPILEVQRDAAGKPIPDPNRPTTHYKYKVYNDSIGTLLPGIGIVVTY